MYILPGAGPVAANISLREAGIPFDLVKVDRRTKRADDGLDFNEVDSKGAVIHDEHNGIRRLHRKRPRWSPA
jgi:glutathione S-transferase